MAIGPSQVVGCTRVCVRTKVHGCAAGVLAAPPGRRCCKMLPRGPCRHLTAITLAAAAAMKEPKLAVARQKMTAVSLAAHCTLPTCQ